MIVHLPADGIHQQLAGDRLHELLFLAEQRSPQRRRSAHLRAVEQHTRRVDRGCSVRGAPLAQRVEVLQAESERIHTRVTARAGGVRAVLLEHLAHGGCLCRLRLVEIRVHARRRRRHRSRQNVLEQPLAANRGRRAMRIGRNRQDARLAEQTPAVRVGERHSPEVAAVDPRNPIVTGQLLVEERVVRGQEIHDAAVFLQLALEEQLGLAHERRAEVVVEPGEAPVRVRRQQPHVANLQPLTEEVPHQCLARARIRQHAPHLPIEHAGVVQLAANREIEQLIIGNAAPEEKRQARCELDVGKAVRLRPACAFGADPPQCETENRG